MINGIDSVAITKLDVLSHFDKIKVCVGYEVNGQLLKSYPNHVDDLSGIKPVYETLDGWNTDISTCLSYNELPEKTKEYLRFIAKLSNINIQIISVGPKREQTFFVETI